VFHIFICSSRKKTKKKNKPRTRNYVKNHICIEAAVSDSFSRAGDIFSWLVKPAGIETMH